jgi:putative DNA primase/helicase
MTPPTLTAGIAALEFGLSIVPIRAIGEPWMEKIGDRWQQRTDRKTGLPAFYGPKVPCGRWEPFQTQQATPDYLRKYLTDREWGHKRGLAVVSGFGNVDCLDFDDVPTWDRFRDAAAADAELAAILERIASGYFELSPRGAPHFLYRCDDLSDGGPLARRPVIVEDGDRRKTLKVLIETRGPGQIVVVAPTPGTCHPTGKPYTLQRGGFATIATVTPDERRKLFALARSFDEVPEPESRPQPERRQHHVGHGHQGEKPGEHFNRVCTAEMWQDMLATWRWEYIGSVSGRPHCWVHGSATSSLSAHLTNQNSLLVYSTSTPLTAWSKDKPVTHSAFFVYAAISHGGNLSAAARALADLGYGSIGERLNRRYAGRLREGACRV